VEGRARTVVANVLGVGEETINDQTSSTDIEQWDSIRHLSLILSLEEEFQIEFPEEQIGKLTSFSTIVSALSAIVEGVQGTQ
jgi:acyl carrier protein